MQATPNPKGLSFKIWCQDLWRTYWVQLQAYYFFFCFVRFTHFAFKQPQKVSRDKRMEQP